MITEIVIVCVSVLHVIMTSACAIELCTKPTGRNLAWWIYFSVATVGIARYL